ncbi:hypothetical protein K6U06_15095 [Acidiferrimicrobium sp. IK]|uniref:hypothetical protein n=1 Tax=Acidiferrimicrobium sp. IK TaxID=2871700 RepID=UPI0021CAECA4|nr:hypothetical protein [Acidiferrimicrobium sp. IK]MCU4185693.1 hypothetical protein [Acidiferrimicrobium sp. IK]
MPDVTDINKLVKDSAYAAVGFGVLGFQKAQVRRRELIEQLSAQGGQVAHLGQRLEGLGDQVGAQLSHLGGQVGAQVGQLRSVAGSGAPTGALRTQLSEVAKLVDKQVQPVRRQLDERLDEVEELLPAPTRNVVKSLRSAATSQEHALRSVIGLDA